MLIFHQGSGYLFNQIGLIPPERPAWPLDPIPPFSVPSVISKAFWGGIWGAVLVLLLGRFSGASYWANWILVGAIALPLGRIVVDGDAHLSPPSDGATSRNTLAMIRQNGDEPEVIDYLKMPPSRERLIELISAMGISVRDLLRRKGTPYDELGLDDPKWTDDELIQFMMQYPILINRPIVVTSRRKV